MTKITKLKRQAQEAARFHGHTPGRFVRHAPRVAVAVMRCQVCGLQAVVNTNPAPNEIELYGSILALGCSGKATV